MKCPACQERAISFSTWGRGLNAFLHACPHCGQALRASRGTIVLFILLLATLPALIYLSESIADHFEILRESRRRLIFGALLLPYILGVSFLHWKTGHYRLAPKPDQKTD